MIFSNWRESPRTVGGDSGQHRAEAHQALAVAARREATGSAERRVGGGPFVMLAYSCSMDSP